MVVKNLTLESENALVDYTQVILTTIKNYHPLISKSLGSKPDIEDCEQDIFLGLWTHFANNPESWEKVVKKIPYITSAIRHQISDVRKKKAKEPTSYDAEENSYLIDNHSDQGEYERKLNEDLDLEDARLTMKGLIDSYSPDEQELLQLIIEGLKPRQIAQMLDKDPAHISIDCNRIKARLRNHLKKTTKSR